MTAAQTSAPAWASPLTRAALAALPADITTATPPQVDEVIRTVGLDAADLDRKYDRAVITIRHAIGQREEQVWKPVRPGSKRGGYTGVWPTSRSEAIDTARAADPTTRAPYTAPVDTVGEAVAALDTITEHMRDTHRVTRRMQDEFVRREGWTRFYKVDNSNGHVHTATDCRTTYETTAWCWPTQLSGADGATVVDAAGPLTCLVCFPDEREDILADRPVRYDAFETTEQRTTRVEREQAAAARKAAKIEKGVTADGSPLVVEVPRSWAPGNERVEVKTERAAELRVVELMAEATRTDRYSEAKQVVLGTAIGELLGALAWKRGTDATAVSASLARKVERKAAQLY